MDFFEAQAEARKLSHRLVLLFGVAVVSMIVVVSGVLGIVLGIGVGPDALHPGFFLAVAVFMLLLIGGGSLARTAQLRKGGSAVAELLGGRRVDPATTDADERRLLNVVEEMALASGVPVPAVFVLDQESGINAFAAGHTLHDAAVAVTRGGLTAFTREELQGVMAHEFSHILNGDMRLNVRLMGTLYGILLITVVGRALLRAGAQSGRMSRARSSGKNNSGVQIFVLGIALVVVGYLGVFFGRLIQAAVSRQREFLADAAAVQFTRNPAGIGGALRRIAGATGGSKVEDPHAEEAGHLFFAEGVRGFMAGAMATHPPLPVRIARVDPGGGVLTPGRLGAANRPVVDAPASAATAAGALGFAGQLPMAALDEARRFLSSLPDSIRVAPQTPEGAAALVLALVLAHSGGPKGQSNEVARHHVDPRMFAQAEGLVPAVQALGVRGRLPLAERAFPALVHLEHDASAGLLRAVSAAAMADGRLDPFDFALFHLLKKALPGGKDPARRSSWEVPLSRLRTEVELLFSLVAWWEDDESAARAAFEHGVAGLPNGDGNGLSLVPRRTLDLARLDGALERLEQSTPEGRRALLEGVAQLLEMGGHAALEQVEVLRALGEALEVPVPAFAPSAPSALADASAGG